MTTEKQHYIDRINNYQAYRVWCNMIRTNDIDIVKALYDNLSQHLSDHPKWPTLKELFKERLKDYVQ